MKSSSYKIGFVDAEGIRLHYLDWGGDGTPLLFLTGMGNSAFVYSEFAPRFVDKFRAVAITRRGHGDSDCPESGYDVDTLAEDLRRIMDSLEIQKAVLVGHSFSNLELCHFAAMHPERLLGLVFLDAAYDRTSPAFKAIREKNPLRNIQVPGATDDYDTIEAHVAATLKYYPFWAEVWGKAMNEDLLHITHKNADGKIVYKMPDAAGAALGNAMNNYTPEDSKIQAPTLSIYALNGGDYYLSLEFMTEEQKAHCIEYFDRVRPSLQRELIEQFRRSVPHAKILEIPRGHHYCFIKHEDLVFEEMNRFLLG